MDQDATHLAVSYALQHTRDVVGVGGDPRVSSPLAVRGNGRPRPPHTSPPGAVREPCRQARDREGIHRREACDRQEAREGQPPPDSSAWRRSENLACSHGMNLHPALPDGGKQKATSFQANPLRGHAGKVPEYVYEDLPGIRSHKGCAGSLANVERQGLAKGSTPTIREQHGCLLGLEESHEFPFLSP